MLTRWWCPWILPVTLVGSVMLVSRPALVVGWVAVCALLGRLLNVWLSRWEAHLLASDHGLYFKKPS
jgi:hypothetical protein